MSKNHLLRYVGIFVSILLITLFVFAAQNEPLNIAHQKVREVMAVQEEATPELMAQEDVLGTAVGQFDDGELGIVIYVNLHGRKLAETIGALPSEIKGKGVMVEITEPFRALIGKPGGVSHTAKQTSPIQLGTSGGWRYDLANGYCCGGTLGSLIQVNGAQYVLSNYHVFEADIVSGGNSRVAETGDYVIQPGLIDVACYAGNAQNVGTLVKLSSLLISNVDASIAQIVPGMVRTDGAILEIGTISNTPTTAYIGQPVKKSGRTTGLSRSKVSGLNATILVQYDNECAGGVAFTKTFTGQIVIANKGSKFIAGGDSGSLMVEDVTTNPRAVGLL